MRVLIASANERDGGAAVAAGRLRDGLLAQGHDAQMFVQTPGDPRSDTIAPRGGLRRTIARARSGIDALPLRRYPARHAPFSVNWLPRFLPPWPDAAAVDVIHLHWVNAGFTSLADLTTLSAPCVWTLHDMWPFTGGCHYDEECGRYRSGCGACPVLHSRNDRDLSSRRWSAKRETFEKAKPTLIAPSRWMASSARNSPLTAGCRIEVIPNGLNLDVFKPVDQAFARSVLGLPQGRRILLFGAVNASTDPRKGHDLLQTAMGVVADQSQSEPPLLAVFGSSPPRRETNFGFETVHFGHLHDDVALVLLYSACDAFIAPSRQDNLPNTVAEALACGTPCIAFDVGGMPDLLTHRVNGWLARPFDTADLAAGIRWLVDADRPQRMSMRQAARDSATASLDLDDHVRRVLSLYAELRSTGNSA